MPCLALKKTGMLICFDGVYCDVTISRSFVRRNITRQNSRNAEISSVVVTLRCLSCTRRDVNYYRGHFGKVRIYRRFMASVA